MRFSGQFNGRFNLRSGLLRHLPVHGCIIASVLMLMPLSAIAQTAPLPPPPESDSDRDTTVAEAPRFTCQVNTGQYTVMYSPQSQPNQMYPWAVPSRLGAGWTPERRCQEISRRLESYRPDGLLDLQTGRENGYDVVCVTTEANPACRIVFTVPPGQDPIATRDAVFQNLTLADSGSTTQPVSTLTNSTTGSSEILETLSGLGLPRLPLPGLGGRGIGGRQGLNLRPFLAVEDGGTGQYLQRNVPRRQLNPDNFR